MIPAPATVPMLQPILNSSGFYVDRIACVTMVFATPTISGNSSGVISTMSPMLTVRSNHAVTGGVGKTVHDGKHKVSPG